MEPASYPTFSRVDSVHKIRLPAKLLKAALKLTMYAVDLESTRYALGGVKLEVADSELHFVATDGRRLATFKVDLPDSSKSPDCIIPNKACKSIHDFCGSEGDAILSIGNSDVQVELDGGVVVSSRLVEGRYPNWKTVIPSVKDYETATIPVGPFMQSVRQAAIVAGAESSGINFQFTEVVCGSTATMPASEAQTFNCRLFIQGSRISFQLAHTFVTDILRSWVETVTVYMKDSDSPVVFVEGDYRCVVMPMQRT